MHCSVCLVLPAVLKLTGKEPGPPPRAQHLQQRKVCSGLSVSSSIQITHYHRQIVVSRAVLKVLSHDITTTAVYPVKTASQDHGTVPLNEPKTITLLLAREAIRRLRTPSTAGRASLPCLPYSVSTTHAISSVLVFQNSGSGIRVKNLI